MDENAIIEIVKNGLDVAGSSISMLVGAVITTLFLRKDTKTAEFEKIKAGKFDEVVDKLLESGKMTYLEYYKCNNFLDIAKKADESLSIIHEVYEEENTRNQEYNFDWFIRFFDAASNISNEEMQKFWASILAGEVYHSGSYSLRAIDTLYNMTPLEAELFADISKIVMDASILFISMEVSGQPENKIWQNINAKYLFDNDSLRILEECGIINGLLMQNKVELEPGESLGFTCGDKILLFKPLDNQKIIIEYSCYNLTMVGTQLYPVVFQGANDNYLTELGNEIKINFPSLAVSLHPMNSMPINLDDEISYNSEIDLLS